MSGYGNVPTEDAQVVQDATRVVARVVTRLPFGSPDQWRLQAFEQVLGAVLSDWVDNGTSGLDTGDEEDLGNLVRLAADTAQAQEEPLRDATFRVVLTSLMSDWVQNWGTEE